MSQVILYHQGAYQIYDKDLRMPIYTSAMTLVEVVKHLRDERGSTVFKDLHEEFDRAHATGSSDGADLYSVIVANNKRLSPDQFVGRFLTL